MSTVHHRRTSLRCKRPRPCEMPVAMPYPRLEEPACCGELSHHHQANLVQVRSRVQVSLEDAEILMGTAERTNVIGHPTYAPYKTCEHRTVLRTGAEMSPTGDAGQLPLQLLSDHLDATELQRSASGPVCNPLPEHVSQLHKATSLPAGIELPGQSASPPVRVPKGIRSNRLRKQASSPGSALARKNGGQSPAKALAIKRSGGATKIVKTTSVVQEEFIKSFRPSPAKNAGGCSGMLLLLEACDALAANPLLADNDSPRPYPAARCDDWVGASPLTRGGGSEHRTRRVNLLEEGAYEAAPAGNSRRIRKPLDNDFLYYAQAGSTGGSMDSNGQIECDGAQEARSGGWGVEEGFWNPGGRRRGGRGELQGPCNHCYAEDSPQWRKGPRCKPVLCNACGTRFLRTRSLGKVRNTKSKAPVREAQQSRFAEPSLDDMMDEDADMDYRAGNAHTWGGSAKHDSLTHEQDNVSSSTTVPGMGYANMRHNCGGLAATHHPDFDAHEEHLMTGLKHPVHDDCASAAASQ